MAELTLLRYPDPRLSLPCRPVEGFDDELGLFADALYRTMKAAPGIGITAAHVGRPIRLVIVDLPETGGRRDFVNPRILSASAETVVYREGSVSMPGAFEDVARPRAIELGYFDLAGHEQQIALSGLAAITLQHEIDQLDGIFWIERLSRLKRDRLLKKWRKAGG